MSTVIKFSYQYKKIDFGVVFDPLIRIKVLTIVGWENYKFLVDTGADTTTLPFYLSKVFKTKIDPSKRTKIGGIERKGIFGYPAKIRIMLGKEELILRSHFIKSDIVPLLGRLDLLDKLSLLFNSKKREIVFC